MNLDSFPYKTSCSTVNQKFSFIGTGIIYQLDPFGSDQNHQTLNVYVIRMLLFVASWQRSQHLSVKKQKIKKKLHSSKWSLIRLMCAWNHLWSDHSHLEMTSDHTIPRPKWPLIIPFPDRSDLWSYHSQTEVTSDHTIPRPKWPLIIPSPDRSDLWSYYCALEPNPRPCNFGLGTHRVRWTSSDQRSLPDGISTWNNIAALSIHLRNNKNGSQIFHRFIFQVL